MSIMKERGNNIVKSIQTYKVHLEKRIRFLEKRVADADLPGSHLKYTQRGDHIYYYTRSAGKDRVLHYIPKSNASLIKSMANSTYIAHTLPVLKKNLAAADRFLALHSGTEEEITAGNLPMELQRMNHDLYPCRALLIDEWQNRSYIRNPFHPEDLIHATIRGEQVRSKSEAMIANELFSRGLAYQPERPVKLPQFGRVIYPDFVILHPDTMQEIFWEHFGMLDDPSYSAAACRRIQELHAAGIKIGENLICTFETKDAPLSSALVNSYIKQYFEN